MFKKIISYFKKKALVRKVPLTKVHTFKDGTNLYTYNENSFLELSSRYYQAIQLEMVHLEILHQTKKQWDNLKNRVIEACLDGIENIDNRRNSIDQFTQIKSAFEYFDGAMNQTKSSSQRLTEMFFCMFFLIDDEIELGYNEAVNDKKLALINSDIEAKEIFFCQVEKILNGFLPLSDSTLKSYIVEMNQKVQVMKNIQGMRSSMNT
jgi:hypothetical protein